MPLKPAQLYLLFFSLYWAQGLPVGFMTQALPVILRMQGVSLAHIGGFGLLMAPWALKALWAPWVDRVGIPALGHYRAWILITQLSSIVILIVLSYLPIESLNHPTYLLLFFIALLSMNCMGATQDIATDALAVRSLKAAQQHWGNMFQVIGSRLGFIVGGGAILWALDFLSWQSTFMLLAGLVALNTIPILYFNEGDSARSSVINAQPVLAKQTLRGYLHSYVRYFSQTKVMFLWLLVLLSVKVTDGLSGPISKPLLVDLGLSLSQIGIYITMLGAAAALLGAFLASLCLQRLARQHAFVLFSILKLLTVFGFAGLAQQYEQGQHVAHWLIYVINALEDLFSAMLLVVILTLVMQYSRHSHAGTDFTLQVSIMALVSGVFYTLSGILGDYLGYKTYLMLIGIVGIFMLLPAYLWQRCYNTEK